MFVAYNLRVDTLDPGLRGRFAQELSLPVPDAGARTKILEIVAQQLRLGSDVDFTLIGKLTPGFVGSDLKSLVSEAGTRAVKRILTSAQPASSFGLDVAIEKENGQGQDDMEIVVLENNVGVAEMIMDKGINGCLDGNANKDDADPVFYFDTAAIDRMCSMQATATPSTDVGSGDSSTLLGVHMSELRVTQADFKDAVKCIQPTAKREGFAVVPNVTWGDVGALAEVREELFQNVLEPIAHPELFRSLGLEVPAGVLFFGPPGCGKTLLAKALANQSGANFISVKGPELLNMYVGESESRVRQVFSRARSSAPCVIFFDELDALCPKRGSGDGGNGVSERVVNQLLTELDGLEVRRDVYIIAATNRLELIDDAMLRPGRLGKLLYVPLPSANDRVSILEAVSRNVSIDRSDAKFDVIAHDPRVEGFSGADLAALVREAGLAVLQEWRQGRIAAAASTELPTWGAASATASATANAAASAAASAASAITPASVSSMAANFSAEALHNIPSICMRHFVTAFDRVHPSVSAEDRRRYCIKPSNITPCHVLIIYHDMADDTKPLSDIYFVSSFLIILIFLFLDTIE
jgi:ribosome biogenesis ATPase